MNQIYSDKSFKVYHFKDEYILHNYRLEGFRHTHIKNYNTCMYLIRLSKRKKCPNDISNYLLDSLLRINDDEEYCRRISNLKNYRKRKKKELYRNNKNYHFKKKNDKGKKKHC
jgi:hypothetical protein